LDLTANNIGNDGAKLLLQSSTTLESLYLYDNPKINPNLYRLVLKAVSKSSLKTLEFAIPKDAKHVVVRNKNEENCDVYFPSGTKAKQFL
jgi:hypothetical protein